MTERTAPLLSLPCETCQHVEGLHSDPQRHVDGSAACAACDCTQYLGYSDRVGRRVFNPHDPLFVAAELELAFGSNPFDLKPPTRRAFPGGIAEAVAYYDAHLATCVRAETLLCRAAGHCAQIVESSRAAVHQAAKLTAAELAKYSLQSFGAEMERMADRMSPHVVTFTRTAKQYGAQRELLERTIAALKAAL